MRSFKQQAFAASRPRKTSPIITNLVQALVIGCSAAAGVGIAAGLLALNGKGSDQAAMVQPAGASQPTAAAPAATPPSMETVAAIAAPPEPVVTAGPPEPAVRPFAADDLQRSPPAIAQTAAAAPEAAAPATPSPASSFLLPSPDEVAVAPLAFAEPVAVAETPDEVAALEAMLAESGDENFKLPAETGERAGGEMVAALAAPGPDAEPRPAGTGLPVAWTTAWVNMRAGPDNDAETLAIVPGGAEIRAEEDCRHWCKVAFEGRDGYIYKTFIRRE